MITVPLRTSDSFDVTRPDRVSDTVLNPSAASTAGSANSSLLYSCQLQCSNVSLDRFRPQLIHKSSLKNLRFLSIYLLERSHTNICQCESAGWIFGVICDIPCQSFLQKPALGFVADTTVCMDPCRKQCMWSGWVLIWTPIYFEVA